MKKKSLKRKEVRRRVRRRNKRKKKNAERNGRLDYDVGWMGRDSRRRADFIWESFFFLTRTTVPLH